MSPSDAYAMTGEEFDAFWRFREAEIRRHNREQKSRRR